MLNRNVAATRVVNLRHEEYDIYIGRAGKGFDGYFGNPVRVGRVCQFCGLLHADAQSTLPCFESYMRQRMLADRGYFEAVRKLAGLRLGCFCKPGPCHGDVLASAAEALR